MWCVFRFLLKKRWCDFKVPKIKFCLTQEQFLFTIDDIFTCAFLARDWRTAIFDWHEENLTLCNDQGAGAPKVYLCLSYLFQLSFMLLIFFGMRIKDKIKRLLPLSRLLKRVNMFYCAALNVSRLSVCWIFLHSVTNLGQFFVRVVPSVTLASLYSYIDRKYLLTPCACRYSMVSF